MTRPDDTIQPLPGWVKGISRPKLLILGHARHGKDTAAEILRDDFGFSFCSSSWFCAEKVVMPFMTKHQGKVYSSVQECYDDRVNWRTVWHDAIWQFNQPDRTRLGRALFAEFDLYVGLRHNLEFHALKNAAVFDKAIWIDRTKYVDLEGKGSMKLEPWMADFWIDNNGDSVKDLRANLHQLVRGQKWA